MPSPRPWTVEVFKEYHAHIVDADGENVRTLYNSVKLAHEIVHCVNNYERMREVLERILKTSLDRPIEALAVIEGMATMALEDLKRGEAGE